MNILIVLLTGIFIGWLTFPLIIFLRARRSDHWDNSNMTNIFRILAHIATHPEDFGKMYYKDGKRPFWYISKDELTEVVKTRPE